MVMRKLRFILAAMITILIVSCLPSLHSIVNDQNRILDDRILGMWTIGEDDDAWFFEKAAEVVFEGEKNKIEYDIGAVSLMPKGMKITKKKELPQYILTYREWDNLDTITTYVVVNLTKIGDHTYMDFKPLATEPRAREGLFSFNYIYGHTFARYQMDEGRLILEFIDGQYIKDLIEKKRIRLKHEVIDNEDIVLTASTEELRAFILKYEDDERLFDDKGELISL